MPTKKPKTPVQPARSMDAAVAAGQRMARKVFRKRGNHTEAHISESELATLLAAAYLHGQDSVAPKANPVVTYECKACGYAIEQPSTVCGRCNEDQLDERNGGPNPAAER